MSVPHSVDDDYVIADPGNDVFWRGVDRDVTDIGCWMWSGGVGYSDCVSHIEMADGRQLRPHEYAWEAMHLILPDSMRQLCPCDGCVNPDHWKDASEVGGDEDVGSVMPRRSRRPKECGRGHPMEGKNVIAHSSGRRTCRACAIIRREHASRSRSRVTNKGRPDREELILALAKSTNVECAVRYGVTEATVRRWRDSYRISRHEIELAADDAQP